MRGNTGFVFIEIFLSHNKEFQPYPSGCGESQTILRRMTSVPTLESQAWGGCEEQAAGGVSLEAAQLPGYRQTDCELETLLEDQGWGSSRGRSVGGLLGTR